MGPEGLGLGGEIWPAGFSAGDDDPPLLTDLPRKRDKKFPEESSLLRLLLLLSLPEDRGISIATCQNLLVNSSASGAGMTVAHMHIQ